MANWITDRTSADVERAKTITQKAKSGTWTEAEQSEWYAGMKGALSYLDYNRIEGGVEEVADFVGASVSVKTNWGQDGYLTTTDAERWISNVKEIRKKCSGYSSTPSSAESFKTLYFSDMNEFERILSDIESLANDHLIYCSEPICGGEPYYGIC